MKLSQLRKQARESLSKKWGRAAMHASLYFLIVLCITYTLSNLGIIGSVVDLLITPALGFGIAATFIKLSRGEQTKHFSFLVDGFKLFSKIWGIAIHTFLKLIVPFALLLISSFLTYAANFMESGIINLIALIVYYISFIWLIVKSFLFVLTNYILFDEPTLSSKEIVEKSAKLMNGNRKRYVLLSLSFFGWIILGLCSFGIAYFWIIPYMEITFIKFYEELSGNSNEDPVNTL